MWVKEKESYLKTPRPKFESGTSAFEVHWANHYSNADFCIPVQSELCYLFEILKINKQYIIGFSQAFIWSGNGHKLGQHVKIPHTF